MSEASTMIAAAQGYVGTLVGQATSAMSSATNAASSIGYSWPGYEDAALPESPPASITTELPILTDIELVFPEEPASSVAFVPIDHISTNGAPSLGVLATPTLEMPTKPSQVANFTGSMPTVNTSFTFPEPPSALLNPNIPEPTLENHTIPARPQVMLPAFDGIKPTDDTTAPTNLDVTLAGAYSGQATSMPAMVNGYVDAMLSKYNPQFHTQMSAIEGQLQKYLAGGTGLSTTVEDAIYARAQAKNDVEALRVQNAAFADAAARGFTLPGGALTSALARARQDAANNNAKQATDIAVAQAEMEQKNLQFAVTTSVGLRTAMMNATLSYMQNLITINGQALDYAKSILNAIVETYNIQVKAFTAKLEAYKADAQVYEVRIRGAMAVIDLYKAEIQALEAMVNVDKAKVDIYRARIDSLTSLANVYRAQVEAAQGRANLEKLKVEVFHSQVQSYSTLVQAKSAEWQGYTAAVQGQEAKVRIYAAQIQAYTARVGGYAAEINGKAEAVKAQAMTNQALATQYQAMMTGYKAVVEARGEKARTQIAVQGQLIQAFQAQVQAEVGNAQVQQAYYKATSDVAISNAQGGLKASLAGVEAQRSFGQTLAQLGTANAQIYGNLASSAMAGMNSLASITVQSTT